MTDNHLSDHYNGISFHNLGDTKNISRKGKFIEFLKWKFFYSSKKVKWPLNASLSTETMPKPANRIYGNDLKVTFVNHATILLQTQGVNILTDPVWSNRVSPLDWIGPCRVTPPGIAIEDLPKIDII
jgi:hypothetical protein